MKKKKGLFYRFLRFNVRIFYRKRIYVNSDKIPTEPSIIVSNHSHAHSPLTTELFFPGEKRTWCEGRLMNIKDAPEHAYNDFFPNKPRGTAWFYKMLSYMIAPLACYLFNNADTVPVYRDLRIIETYRKSVQELKDGNHIVIFPEDHVKYNEIVNEFHDRFVDVARIYYKNTGKCLKFVPMYNGAKLKTVVVGNPITYDPLIPIEEQRQIVTNYLKGEITRLAKTLPQHVVVPFDVISKKDYPLSKKEGECETTVFPDKERKKIKEQRKLNKKNKKKLS